MTHALIVTAVCNTDLESLGFETFGTDRDGESALYAVGTYEELEAVVAIWTTRECHPKPHGKFTAYMTTEGFEVGWPLIVRIGKQT